MVDHKVGTREEWVAAREALLAREKGYEIVSAADLPTEAVWVRQHHERFDGRGYPDGIAGEAIPLESRIIFVADAFER